MTTPSAIPRDRDRYDQEVERLTKEPKLNWIECGASLPPIGRRVMTKIDDSEGIRNEQVMYRGGTNGCLWFLPDGSMYVYYTPTHWAEITTDPYMPPMLEEKI